MNATELGEFAPYPNPKGLILATSIEFGSASVPVNGIETAVVVLKVAGVVPTDDGQEDVGFTVGITAGSSPGVGGLITSIARKLLAEAN